MNLFSRKKEIPLDEIHLAKQARKGDRDAFTQLMKLYKSYLYKVAFLHVKNEDLALDMIQECAYRGFLHVDKLKEPQYFKTWITRILINICIDALKKQQTHLVLDEQITLADKSKGISVEEKLDLYDAIDCLREQYKTVIILKYMEDLSLKDIAQLMDIPENTVKTYLSRAKKELSTILQEGYLND